MERRRGVFPSTVGHGTAQYGYMAKVGDPYEGASLLILPKEAYEQVPNGASSVPESCGGDPACNTLLCFVV